MRYPIEHKTDTRRRIVDTASKAFRRHGATGVSVSQIMAEAGLTVGGFYRHFESKDELFQEALENAMAETLALLRRVEGNSELEGDEWLRRAASIYLTSTHRDKHDTGCPLPALSAEVGRRGGGRPTELCGVTSAACQRDRRPGRPAESRDRTRGSRARGRVRRELPLATKVLLTPGL